MIIGNFVDPRLMGQKLSLSTLAVFLSMVFFGWLWGLAGMLLAVPLMMAIKVFLAHHQGSRHFAILLEK
jgi:predicted PurR-regulated permease PerM